jgi:hypothetical protein
MNVKLFILSAILLLIIFQSCNRDNSSECPNPSTTYHRNIDTLNIPYKKGKSFIYKDNNGNLIITKINIDTLFYNCDLVRVTNPNCDVKNTVCYSNKKYFFDTLGNILINNQYDRYSITFNGSDFSLLSDALVNPEIPDYPYYKYIYYNKSYPDVRLITNAQNDSLYINYNDGILKVINSNGTFTIQ